MTMTLAGEVETQVKDGVEVAVASGLPLVVEAFRLAAEAGGLAFVARVGRVDRGDSPVAAWAVFDPAAPSYEREELWLRWVPGKRYRKGTVVASRFTSVLTRRHRVHLVTVPLRFALERVLGDLVTGGTR